MDQRGVFLPRFPIGRLRTQIDAARLLAWLASPDAGRVTGPVIHTKGRSMRGERRVGLRRRHMV